MALTKGKFKNSIIVHLALMLIIALAFYMVLFSSLKQITNHGEEVKVPVLIGKTHSQAISELKKAGFDIDIDSAYELKQPPQVVLSQIPDTGSFVKKGRTIFLTVNKAQAPLTPMPELTGLSYRSAEMVIRSNKLRLGDTIYRPDIADGAILEQLFEGRTIEKGELLPQGSKIDLVIGDGLGNTEFDVPDVVGMNYEEGIAVLNAMGLQFIDIWEGNIKDSATAVIFYQSPSANNPMGGVNQIKEGDFIDIKVSQGNNRVDVDQKKSKPVNKPHKGNNSSDERFINPEEDY